MYFVALVGQKGHGRAFCGSIPLLAHQGSCDGLALILLVSST